MLTGTVIDAGDGPAFCHIVRESYPPQCGDPVPLLEWDRSAVTYTEASGVRFGDYSFTGTRVGDSIRVTEIAR